MSRSTTMDWLKPIIKANVSGTAAKELHDALMQGQARLLTFWSLDNDTLHVPPLDRYHVGQMTYMLFLAALLSTQHCEIEANICDHYSLESTPSDTASSFFGSRKSWREGRIRLRSFLDRSFLDPENAFTIYNLRDEFAKDMLDSSDLYAEARKAWDETERLLDAYGKPLINGADYRYPRRVNTRSQRFIKFHNILRDQLYAAISIEETAALLFIRTRRPDWLRSEWTGDFIGWLANKLLRNAGTEFILEGERNCYSWHLHLLLAKLTVLRATRKPLDSISLKIVPFRDIPNIRGKAFMEFAKKGQALFFRDILNPTSSASKFRNFRTNAKDAKTRIRSLVARVAHKTFLSRLVISLASKLSDYQLDRVQILHASDIHFGVEFSFGSKKSEAQWSPTSKLPHYLQTRYNADKPHLVLISGDFTSVCKRSEFKQAETFIATLLEKKALQALPGYTDVHAHQIMAVPGNHDFAWDLTPTHQADNFKRFIRNTGILSPWTDTDSSSMCKIIKPDNDVPLRLMYFDKLGIAVILACSTTGTLCSSDKVRYKKIRSSGAKLSNAQWRTVRRLLNQDHPEFPPDHHTALNSCIEQLYEDEDNANAQIVFMSHHHVDDIDHEVRSVRGTAEMKQILINANALMWLHGHIHWPYLGTSSEGLTLCGAGTLGGWTAEGHSANIIQIGNRDSHDNSLSRLEYRMSTGSFRISDVIKD